MAKKKQQVRKRKKVRVTPEGKGKNKVEDKGNAVKLTLQFPIRDWELFKIACQKYGRTYEEVLNELAVKWAEDVMKTELSPPG